MYVGVVMEREERTMIKKYDRFFNQKTKIVPHENA